MFLFNGTTETLSFRLPEQTRGLKWSLLFDTSADSPLDIFPDMDGPPAPANRQVELVYRSMKAFVAERPGGKA
jgi:glycogen operon protein